MKLLTIKSLAILISAIFVVILSLLLSAFIFRWGQPDEPSEAPELILVLEAQSNLPFQILIPAYLPEGFERASVEILTDQTGPNGEVLVSLQYVHLLGVNLTLYEWVPTDSVVDSQLSSTGMSIHQCSCMMIPGQQSNSTRSMYDDGTIRVTAESSDSALLSAQHIQLILSTLAPATGLLTYTTPEEISRVDSFPPAEEIPVNADGFQEVNLIVSAGSYTPAHFSVLEGIPVRVTFRQLGDVGCGNELYMQWGGDKFGYLALSGIQDMQVLEFTPEESGEFLFSCAHLIYRGLMTVNK